MIASNRGGQTLRLFASEWFERRRDGAPRRVAGLMRDQFLDRRRHRIVQERIDQRGDPQVILAVVRKRHEQPGNDVRQPRDRAARTETHRFGEPPLVADQDHQLGVLGEKRPCIPHSPDESFTPCTVAGKRFLSRPISARLSGTSVTDGM